MKLKRRRAVEVPPKIRSFIDSIVAIPFENIEDLLRSFVWEFEKGDFHHWVDLFNHFDTFFEKYIKSRKDLQLEDNFLEHDPPFPRDAVLQILRVIRIILENCTNKHFYSSYEHHLSALLASTDADVVEAALQTLAAFLKKTIGKYIIKDVSLNSRLFAFAQGWGGKEEGLGLIACAVHNEPDPVAYELGCTLHFEFYSMNVSSDESPPSEQVVQGLQIIHFPNIIVFTESDLQILNKLVIDYKVPSSLRFTLLTRLRFARAFSSLAARQQYTRIRLYAFLVLVQACSDAVDLVSFFNAEPEFINELITLLSFEDAAPENIQILSLHSLVALCQERSRQSNVLTTVTSGGHRGILSSLMQKAIDSVVNNSSKWSVVFAEALLSLVTVLVSSSSGCSAMRESVFIPTLLPLLKDTDSQHLHVVSMAVHVLESFMDYSNPAAALFRDLGGLDDTILRLKMEVSYMENGSKQQGACIDLDSAQCNGAQLVTNTSSDLDNMQLFYSETLVAYHRRLLIKALLRAISLGTYAPGSTARIYGSEESLLPQCLCIIFKRAKDFGGNVFSLAATVMSDLIHKDPTCFAVLEAGGLPSAFMDAIMDSVLCSAEAIKCIPQCLDALCLNNNGLQAVKDRNALRCFVNIFTSRTYLRALAGDTPGSLSSGLDELMRHASSLREPGVDMLIEILNGIARLGSGEVAYSPNVSASCSTPVPMETDVEDRNIVSSDDKDSCKTDCSQPPFLSSSDTSSVNVELFLPDCISNVARLLETILQNSDTCRIFVDKKGIESVLQLFTLPLMPLSVSLGQSISVAFKNFSPQHSASLARAVCSLLREHLKSTNELLVSVGAAQLAQLEAVMRTNVLRCLCALEGILSLSNSLLKGTTAVVSELGSADADVLKDLGRAYKEILWQISMICDSKVDEKHNAETESEGGAAAVSNTAGRESDDDTNIPVVRYMNPVSVRNNSHSQWGVERDFLSVVRSGEGLTRRSRHGLPRIRGGRTASRHLEALHMDSDVPADFVETSSQDLRKRSPDVLVLENLNKLASTIRSFFTSLVKGFTLPNRRRTESGSLSLASKSIGTALAKVFLEAFDFSGHSSSVGLDIPLSVKCRYLGKVVDDMMALTFDPRRRTCYTTMINTFYVQGTFKELLTTFEATSQLLWTLPYSIPASGIDSEKIGDGNNLLHSSWLLDTLQNYCRLLEYFVNSSLLLSPNSASQAQLLVQPVPVGLSIGLFPVPREPEAFVRMLQSQVLDAVLPVWNHHMFPNCHPGFITSIVSLITHVYCGVGDVKRNRNVTSGNTSQRFMAPPPDEGTIATIVEMGFTRERAEEALRRVETNSVEMAMEWLFNHVEDPVPEDDELARALALSLGNTETSKVDSTERSIGVLPEEGQTETPPVDGILATAMKLFQGSESMAFPLTDLFVTLCNRNKGEDRPRVTSYLIQQLKLCPLDFSKDTSVLCMLSHTLALLLSEDGSTREIAVQNGIASIAIDMLTNFIARPGSGSEHPVPKCITALLLILDNLLQSRLRLSADSTEAIPVGSFSDSSVENASLLVSKAVAETNSTASGKENESGGTFEKIFGKPTGCLTMEESCKVLTIACNLIKQHVPSAVMQAVLQVCARLTKTHALALQFLENGGLVALFSLPRSCFFPGYDTLASSIIRHLLEDPQTLQTAMELEIRQTLSGNRHASRISPQAFLTSMAPVVSRDPEVFMKAVATVCQLESSGGRTIVVLSKEKEKEKSKASGVEHGISSNDSVRIPENKTHDGSGKCSKGYKKIPANLAQVMDQLLEMVLRFPSPKKEEDCKSYESAMEVDEPATKVKGKSKIDETNKIDADTLSERSAALAKTSFILRLLSDILLMYVHAVGVILRRDLEMCQLRGSNQPECGSGGMLHHFLHQLLPLSTDKSAGPDEWREKLSENASWFLVVLCSRSNEGRRRVINELVNTLSSLSNSRNVSSKSILLPDKRVYIFVDLVYSILSKNSSSSNLPVSVCSPDIARSMIDGGMVQCLSGILQVLDLDHPDAPKTVNLILKALECLTRVANASEQVVKSDVLNKKKTIGCGGRPDDQITTTSVLHVEEPNQSSSPREVMDVVGNEQQPQGQFQNENNGHGNPSRSLEQEMRTEVEDNVRSNPSLELGMDIMRDEMEEGGSLQNTDQIEMTFHVENRVDDDMGDEDDDMADDGEDDEDDDEGEDEDEDIGADGTALMSLADTDVEDHDDTGLGDEYNDDMVDEEDEDFDENHIIEVRWREALDGLDHLQVPGQPGSTAGLIGISAEPFEGVNVDDLFGLHRPLGFERHRQTSRSSFERSVPEGSGPQHPFLVRPSQSGDLVSTWSLGGNSTRDPEPASSRNFDIAHFYMFDAPVLPYDNATANLFSDRLGGTAPPTLADFSVGLESLRMPGHRGPGDGRWTDDGQPQAGGQAAAIAQAVEEQFVSQLQRNALAPAERLQQNIELSEEQLNSQTANDGQRTEEGDTAVVSQNDVQDHGGDHETMLQEIIQPSEDVSCQECANADVAVEPSGEQAEEPTSDSAFVPGDPSNAHDGMTVGEGNGSNEQVEMTPDLATPSTFSEFDPQHGRGSEVFTNINDILLQDVCHNRRESQCSNHALASAGAEISSAGNGLQGSGDVDMNGVGIEENHTNHALPFSELNVQEPSSRQNTRVDQDAGQNEETSNDTPNANGIDPTFLEALPEDLRAEVLASQQAQSAQPPTYTPPVAEDIDPEFLAALPPDIQAEVLAQQRAQRVAQQTEGQPVDMDNASIIATFPADLREEVLLTSSDAVLSALPSPLLAEAQMLRDRAISHYQARSLFGSGHRLNSRRNGLGFDRQTIMDRGVGVTIGRRPSSSLAESLKLKDVEGEPLLDADALKALIRLLRLTQPLGKGLLQRLLFNLCAHSNTRTTLICLLLDMIKPETDGTGGGLRTVNSQRLYGCQSNIVYGRSQFFDGLPPLVLRRVLEILTYLATNHSAVANALFYLDSLLTQASSSLIYLESRKDKGKEKIVEGDLSNPSGNFKKGDIPFVLFLKLLSRPLFLQSTAHLEQVMSLLQVIVYTTASKLDFQSHAEQATVGIQNLSGNEAESAGQRENALSEIDSNQDDSSARVDSSTSNRQKSTDAYSIFLQLPKSDLRNLCNLLGHEGLSDKVYMLAGEVLKKLALVAIPHRKFFISELSDLAHVLSSSAVSELITLKNTNMLGLSAGSMAGVAILRVLQTLNLLASPSLDRHKGVESVVEEEEQALMWKLNVALEPLWQELSDCISSTETELSQSSFSSIMSNINVGEHLQGSSSLTPLPPATQRLLPFIEAFFVLCEKSQANNSVLQQDQTNATAREVKESAGGSLGALPMNCGVDTSRRLDGAVTFARFAERHRQLLNAFIRQNPGLLEKSLSMMLKTPRLIDFDNKRAYFRSRVRQQHEQHLSGPLRINVRRAYVLEDSYNQLRMKPSLDLKGRLNVLFQGEEGIDAGGLTREWYQLLSRVIFDKGALLFTTVGNNATFQPNPNSVYQTEHLSYFKFVGRVVAKALFDGQLLDVYFTRSFYKHILGVKVTYHDIEAVDPDYYKNLKWMLENDVSDIPDLTFSMDADEEKHILYEKTEVTDYELKPGGRNIRVTEETKHEYVDLVAEHILTNAIRPQINSFLEGFNELVPRELISIFNDKELELLISGLPEIDLDDLKANTEYTGYTAVSSVVQWFWEVVKAFSKEDMARLLQFVTGTSKVPLEGFKALQGISGPQRFQIHKAYGAPERLPSAHTCFNQLDLPEYTSKEQLQKCLLLAIHEASEGFGFG